MHENKITRSKEKEQEQRMRFLLDRIRDAESGLRLRSHKPGLDRGP